ncbi:MAG: hypothetical protein R3C17_01730 [Planctomycetaceae bacterium]
MNPTLRSIKMELFGRRAVLVVIGLLSLGAVGAGYVLFLQWHGKGLIQRNELIDLQRLVEDRKWLATRLLTAAYDLQNKEAFELLLKTGASLDGISHKRLTLLHSAAQSRFVLAGSAPAIRCESQLF